MLMTLHGDCCLLYHTGMMIVLLEERPSCLFIVVVVACPIVEELKTKHPRNFKVLTNIYLLNLKIEFSVTGNDSNTTFV